MIGNPYKGKNFRGLLRYLHEGRQGEENPHRVVWSEARNLPGTDPSMVAGIMKATTSLAQRASRPVYHLPISWPPDEQPPKEVQIQVAETLLEDLGLSEHQHLIVAHDDGDCPHIHVVVNTVHPETGRVWNAWRDVYRIMESLERQERELGLRIVDRPDLEEHRTGKKDPDRQKNPTRGERLRAKREGDTPLAKWSEIKMREIRTGIRDHFRDATSWAELEARLARHNLSLQQAGQGFRITDGKHFMTLSKIGKHARQDRLENRFQQTWEDYEIDREVTPAEVDQLEPPDSIVEELKQRKARQQAQTRAEATARVKHALTATNRYAWFRAKEKEAADLGAKLIVDRRALRQNEFVARKIDADIAVADEDVDGILTQLYRNPRAARGALDRRLAAGESLDEIDLSTIGKKRGWNLLGFRTKARREANAALGRLPRAHQRLSRLMNQKEVSDHDRLTLHAKIGASEEAFERARQTIGDRDGRNERRLAHWREMRDAMRQVTQDDIHAADLPEDHRDHLLSAWEQVLQSERQAERSRVRREMEREQDRGR